MKEVLFRVPAATALVLLAMVGLSESFAQQPTNTADKQTEPVLIDPNSSTPNPLLFKLDSDEQDKNHDTAPARIEPVLIDPNSLTPNPLLFPLDSDENRLDPVAAKKDAKIQKDLLGRIPAATRTQFRNHILPSIQSGADLEFLSAMEKLIAKQTPESVSALEAYCQASGLGLLKDRFTRILVEGIEQGLPVNVKKLNPVFAQYATAALIGKVESELEEIGKHAIMQDPLLPPEDWQESDELFWEVHVWKNRFLNLNRLVQYSIGITQPMLKRAIKEQNQADVDRLQQPLRLAAEVQSKYDEMLEREAEVRMLELAKAEKVLRTENDFEQRLHAAFALEMHGGELEIFFQNHKQGLFGRPLLNDQQEIAKAVGLLKSGREHGKEVIEKAVLLRVGAHWWLRGRYGMASMAQGLLKPEQAMRSPGLMFGLFMPKDRPQAIGFFDERTGDVVPGYERRHYFTWAVERRDLFTSYSSKTYTDKNSSVTGTSASHFW